ncbi:endonuclease/exonuclease/phosphatase family protein [Nocardioides sp. CPCC 206347]|uniref:endonuclease/exonuclease/phosphatase family protein n=1 Tax=Nocardioides sp. CPCC 206347 TaxID=3406463 RepID=UPI003B42EFA2
MELRRRAALGLVAVAVTTALGAAALTAVQSSTPDRDAEVVGAPESSAALPAATTSARFQVASFNILGAGHTDGANPRKGYAKSPVRLQRALQVLTNNGIDVVGFQEMHGSQQDLWEKIASPTWLTYPLNTMTDSAGHNSISWRNNTFIAVEKHTFGVPYFYGKLIQMPYVLLQHRSSGERAWFINVHNPADTFGNAEAYRNAATRAEIALVNKLRAANPTIPVFLTGDMNERSDFICPVMKGTELESAQPGGYISGSTCTAPPRSQIDWVTATPDVTFWGYQALRDSLVKATTDHPIIIANVDIPPRWARSRGIKRVVVISIEGLRSGLIGADAAAPLVPNLRSIRAKGASTLNARTAIERVTPLPNAFSLLTARPIYVPAGGHGMSTATDPGTTPHAVTGQYMSSVFDMVHNRGRSTALYSSDPAATALDRSWNATNGGGDNFGQDNGRDKITRTVRTTGDGALVSQVRTDLNVRPAAFSYVQLADLGRIGARYGYSSAQYQRAVKIADTYVGRIINTVKGNAALVRSTLIVVTSGSGAGSGNEASLLRYQVPVLVWGNGVEAGGDLYAMNPLLTNPGVARGSYTGPQPIFTGAIANLALAVLGIGQLPRGLLNRAQNFTVFPRG